MSILIKNMEMPFDGSFSTIVILPDGTMQTRRGDPLPYKAVSIPPHGRLIDADELGKRIKAEGTNQAEQLATRFDPVVRAYGDCYGMVLSAPTVIEADGE